jgi:hypothetical protein
MRYYPDLAQLVFVLEREDPPVWRRVHVPALMQLGGLHRVIQGVMGWDNRLPHRFILAGDIYKRVAPGEALDPKRERHWRLDSALYPSKMFWYVYGAHDECGIALFGKSTSRAARIGAIRVASEATVPVRQTLARRSTLAPLIGNSGADCQNAKLVRQCLRVNSLSQLVFPRGAAYSLD